MSINGYFAACENSREWRRLDAARIAASAARQAMPVGSSKADYAYANSRWSEACAALEACEARIAGGAL